MKNISELRDCYGCGVCTKVCPVNIISLRENGSGFYEPVIDEQDKCIGCGLCLKVCGFNNGLDVVAPDKIAAYASYSLDPNVRNRCSSGGIGFEIGRYLIEKGFNAIGVRYNVQSERAEHYIAATVEDFMPSVGSKYIPSFTESAFGRIERGKRYLVTGTPCQIHSFRLMIRKLRIEGNFVLLDFFCHGTPSLKLWDKYLESVREAIGEISFVSWRNKSTGWHDSWAMQADSEPNNDSFNLSIKEKKHLYASRWTQGDLFYKFFLGNVCLNKCCYASCKYKMTDSAADVRIGDLWGRKYQGDNFGTSGVLALTPRGRELLTEMSAAVELIPESVAVVTEGQMPVAPSEPFIRNKIIKELGGKQTLAQIAATTLRRYRLICLPKRVLNKLGYILFRKPISH